MNNQKILLELLESDYNVGFLVLLYYICRKIVHHPAGIHTIIIQNCQLVIKAIDKLIPGENMDNFCETNKRDIEGYQITAHTDNIKENLFDEHFGYILCKLNLKQNKLTGKLELIPKSN